MPIAEPPEDDDRGEQGACSQTLAAKIPGRSTLSLESRRAEASKFRPADDFTSARVNYMLESKVMI